MSSYLIHIKRPLLPTVDIGCSPTKVISLCFVLFNSTPRQLSRIYEGGYLVLVLFNRSRLQLFILGREVACPCIFHRLEYSAAASLNLMHSGTAFVTRL